MARFMIYHLSVTVYQNELKLFKSNRFTYIWLKLYGLVDLFMLDR